MSRCKKISKHKKIMKLLKKYKKSALKISRCFGKVFLNKTESITHEIGLRYEVSKVKNHKIIGYGATHIPLKGEIYDE